MSTSGIHPVVGVRAVDLCGLAITTTAQAMLFQ
jgi:hypothetical protein